MKDEEFVFRRDVREKASTARSARNKRTHSGKRGRVKLPSDYMTRKEINAMNGEVKSYRLNDPMTWSEFKSMPDDIKVTYIKLLREKFNCFDSAVAEMMRVNKCTFSQEIKRLGLGHGTKHGGNKTWTEREAFWAWASGCSTTAEETTEEGLTEEVAEITIEAEEHNVRCQIPSSGNMVFEGKIEEVVNSIISLLGGADVHISVTWDVLS